MFVTITKLCIESFLIINVCTFFNFQHIFYEILSEKFELVFPSKHSEKLIELFFPSNHSEILTNLTDMQAVQIFVQC